MLQKGRILKSGITRAVDTEVLKEWKKGKLKEILKLYEPENIFNADKTGLFWQLLPEKAYNLSLQSSMPVEQQD